MSFKFKYESLLSYRQHLKEKAEIDLVWAQQQLKSCRIVLEGYQEDQNKASRNLESSLKEKISSHLLSEHSYYMKALEDRIQTQELEVNGWEKVVKEKMNILLTKMKQYKVIEKLKEKNFKKWNQDQNLLEQKSINETAIIRHGKESL